MLETLVVEVMDRVGRAESGALQAEGQARLGNSPVPASNAPVICAAVRLSLREELLRLVSCSSTE